jgi:hypothetical protein
MNEAEKIQQQVAEVKQQLRNSGLPTKLRMIWEEVRFFPAWHNDKTFRIHPRLLQAQELPHGCLQFVVDGNKFDLQFERDYRPLESGDYTADLIVRFNGELVLQSRFFGTENRWQEIEWSYFDSECYREGAWSAAFVKFATEAKSIVTQQQTEIARKRTESPEAIKDLKSRFGIP